MIIIVNLLLCYCIMSFDKLNYQVDLYGALHVCRVFNHKLECHFGWVNGLMTPTLLKRIICWY